MNRVEQQKWIHQWQRASVALERVREEELAAMTARAAAVAADALMQLPAPAAGDRQGQVNSGLVIQQHFFMRAFSS